MFEYVQHVLEWINTYGADKVFLVFFFGLYWSARKRLDRIQDERLEDNKKALAALIEAKHTFSIMSDQNEELIQLVRDSDVLDRGEFGKIRGALDRILDKLEAANER